METKTHWKKAFKSDYLSSSDIEDKDLLLTIEFVKYQECMTQSGKKFCNVAHFTDSSIKPMILNVGNSKIVKKFAGNKRHLEDWLNIPVQIYVDNAVKFGADTVEGLRIRKAQPVKKKKLIPLTDEKFSDAVKFVNDGKSVEDLKKYYSLSEEMEEKLKNSLIDGV